jgi:HEAT repeat protein
MTPVAPKLPAKATTGDLVKSASTVRGSALKGVVTELAKREGKDVIGGLATVAGSYDKEAQKWGREGMDTYMGRQSSSTVKDYFDHSSAEIRKGAIRAARAKHEELTPRIIDALTDKDKGVRAEARGALKKLAKDKEDFGPEDGATAAEQREAQKKWKAWWQKQK